MNGTDKRTMHTGGAQLLLMVREHSTQIAFPSTNVSLPNTSKLLVVSTEVLVGKVFFFLSSNGKEKKQKSMNMQSSPFQIVYLKWFIYIMTFILKD